MPPRHPARRTGLPRLWLMTDERMGEALWDALARLPKGSGVVFRHHATPAAERRALFARVLKVARARRLMVLSAGGRLPGAAGSHNRRPDRGLYSRSAHDRGELIAARRAGADVAFVSPVFATRSHPGARALGPVRLGLLIRDAGLPLVALGGMTGPRARRLAALRLHGWAAIDAWSGVAGR